jgi:hypothetical protein
MVVVSLYGVTVHHVYYRILVYYVGNEIHGRSW